MKTARKAIIVLLLTFVLFIIAEYVKSFNCLWGNFLLAAIPSAFVVVLDYLIFYEFIPNVMIRTPYFEDQTLKIPADNMGDFAAYNIEIEACALDVDDQVTYHFKADYKKFLMLPSNKNGNDNNRTFSFSDVEDPVRNYHNSNYADVINLITDHNHLVRVRVYSQHSLSGLGKCHEYYFRCQNYDFFPVEGPKVISPKSSPSPKVR